MKYEHKVYVKGFALKVAPSDRAVDVMHAAIIGTVTGLGGRSLDGVELEVVDIPDATKMFQKAMREVDA